jgi:uncharacterized protein
MQDLAAIAPTAIHPSILDNHILVISIFACLFAQFLKVISELIIHQKFNFRTLVGSGGMPSSHSSLVTALAVGVGQASGWESPNFAIALIFAVIVMYDAAGVRQAAGKQARILNQIVDELFREDSKFNEQRLKELIGHTPVQVIAGAALGGAIAWFSAPAY